MNDVELMRLFVMLRRPIPWDPIPWWIKLNNEQIARFNEVQQRLNTKIAEIEAQKMKELGEIAGFMK
jgi:phosphatidylinositol kinase/protein kinase (PI-3  family)